MKHANPKYIITAIVLIFLTVCGMAHAQTASDSIQAVDTLSAQVLNEVTVKARRIVNDGDHMNLYLSEENRKFGTNALDAVSSMPLFTTTINATSLTSWDRQDVFILINGVPSTAMALRTYKADMIKKVEYYQNAPAQYMMFTSGPLVNVEIKKVHDRLYSGYFNTKNAVTMGYGANQGSLSFQDSLNMVRVNYFGSYANVTKRRDSFYDYDDFGIRTDYAGRSHQSWSSNSVSATYQRYQGAHLFNAQIAYGSSPAKDREARTVRIENSDAAYDGTGENLLESGSKNLNLSLYYNYSFKNGAYLSFNVINTLGWAHSESGQWLTGNNSNLLDDYDVHSYFKNRTYAFSAHSMFVKPNVVGGRFQVSARYMYRHLNQHSLASEYSNRSDDEWITIGEYWTYHNEFGFYPIIGVRLDTQRFLGESYTRLNPLVRLLGQWVAKGKLEGLSGQLTVAIRQQGPSLGDLSIGKSYIDPLFVSSGNPNLKSYWWLSTNLTMHYFFPNSSNRISIVIAPEYRHHPYVPVINNDGQQMTLRPENIQSSRGMEAYINTSWSLLKWLKVQPYVEYYSTHFRTPLQQVKLTKLRAGGSIVTTFGDFESVLSINSPTYDYDGDIFIRGGWQCALSAQYKVRNWAFGAEYHFLGRNDYRSADLPGFSFIDRTNAKKFYKLVELSAVYSFSVGKARRHASKNINESIDETGLNKYNSVNR